MKIRKVTLFQNMKMINKKFPFFSQTIQDIEKRYYTKLFTGKSSTNFLTRCIFFFCYKKALLKLKNSIF